MSDYQAQYLYDKIVNLKFFDASGNLIYDMPTSVYGRKPYVRITGSVLPNNVVASIKLRVTNLVLAIPLDKIAKITAQSGYTNGPKGTLTLSVNISYIETPGPDGVTYFECWLGDFQAWNDGDAGTGSYAIGTSYKKILGDLCNKIGATLVFNATDKTCKAPFSLHDKAKNVIQEIATVTKYVTFIFNHNLYVYNSDYSADAKLAGVVALQYLLSPPRLDAGGYSITAPWDPNVAPGTVLLMAASFGVQRGANQSVVSTKDQKYFSVIALDFDFETVGSVNQMSLIAVPLNGAPIFPGAPAYFGGSQ